MLQNSSIRAARVKVLCGNESSLKTTHIDLIVLDVMMPEMDGYDFLKTVRDGGSDIPVLIITAKDSAEDLRKAFMLGTDDFMVKPVDETEMLLKILVTAQPLP